MTPQAVLGISNDGLNLVANLLILCVVVIWLACVYWTLADARRRIKDPLVVATATAAALFPFVGTIVYLIIRPPEYLEDVLERDLETSAARARLAQLRENCCPRCECPTKDDYLRCPKCMHKLRDPCRQCARPLQPGWQTCPYCEAPVPQVKAPATARRQRPSSSRTVVPPGPGRKVVNEVSKAKRSNK